MVNKSTFSWSATWIVKIILVAFTFHLTLRLNLETRFLFSGGELSQPSSALAWLCLFIMPSCLNSKEIWNGDCWNPSTKWNLTRFNKNIFNNPECPLEMFIISVKGEKPLPKMMNIFIGYSWIFELNYIVFAFGHLIANNILNAQIITNWNVYCWKYSKQWPQSVAWFLEMLWHF